eukprot:CAMPEP_0175065762 /NCGR_PEP_ID=MMETSP0052_2-20121109/16121_1 /TAXON_ID=51329 ORGANISM="Polytomella parva, Strain SAG 63-3" /NCGR_SAMPLE_ID=MMETSP0052_2 /ASSEMBLY_ACC=CAM_ASM_000194 /LENGTH=427 /DNA_ID=CAMNT_0016332365 /DNA_START=179 /DNA_END=1461 /DNA_ORIENTATION=+
MEQISRNRFINSDQSSNKDENTNAFKEYLSRKKAAFERGDDFDESFVPSNYGPSNQENDDDEGESNQMKPIGEENVGYLLLKKMGWKGKGLGKEGGIVEPIKSSPIEPTLRLGLGRHEEEESISESISRKRLEIEVIAQEDETSAKIREVSEARVAKRDADVKEINRTFYCETCDKQYKMATELSEHLSSYDHHHRKRMRESMAQKRESGREERLRQERRDADKEIARLAKKIEAAKKLQELRGEPQVPKPKTTTSNHVSVSSFSFAHTLKPVGGEDEGGKLDKTSKQSGWSESAMETVCNQPTTFNCVKQTPSDLRDYPIIIITRINPVTSTPSRTPNHTASTSSTSIPFTGFSPTTSKSKSKSISERNSSSTPIPLPTSAASHTTLFPILPTTIPISPVPILPPATAAAVLNYAADISITARAQL